MITSISIKTSLNYEELDRLFKTPCRHDVLRRASIFAVLSGLRRGDILALDWKDYERDNKGKPTFRIVTKKTGAVFHHPVSAEAMEACGPAGDGLMFKAYTRDAAPGQRSRYSDNCFPPLPQVPGQFHVLPPLYEGSPRRSQR